MFDYWITFQIEILSTNSEIYETEISSIQIAWTKDLDSGSVLYKSVLGKYNQIVLL